MRSIAIAVLLSVAVIAHAGQAGEATPAAQRSAIFLFGPAGAENARQAARSASAVSRRWMSVPGSTAEVRRSGSPEGLPLDPKTSVKSLDQAFLDAARQGRDTDPSAFLTSLDAAAQALARRPGLRLLVAIVEQPPLSTDAENQVNQTIEFCQANAVRVLVLDPAEVPSKTAVGSLRLLASATGGALIRDPRALDGNIRMLSAEAQLPASPGAATTASGQPVSASELPALPTDLPVYTHFMGISPRNAMEVGSIRSVGSGLGGISGVERGPEGASTGGRPMQGLLFVESPLNALQFDTDDNAGTYTARARVTQIVRAASGKIVWQASKQVTLHGPLRKLESRRSGALCYMRQVVLPAGRYTVEATVEDLISGKSGGIRGPLRTELSSAGFTLSDALMVRPFNAAADRFEADQVLNYGGNALSPVLDPVYRANEPFDLQILFVLYPDLYGAMPDLSLEILRNGHVVGRSALPFNEKIRNNVLESENSHLSTTGGASGALRMRGEQQHEYPYLATLRGARLGPGEYEARVTARQGGKVLTRTTTFRVAGSERTAVLASTATGASLPSPPQKEDPEDAEVTLPEVDPVQLNAAAALSEAEQKRIWEDAAASALSYASRLPNFRCNRETHRLTAPVKSPDNFREADALIEELTYERGKETYRTVEVNGQKSSIERDDLKGVRSRGEFGALLNSVFGPEVAAQFKWTGRAMAGGVLCEVIDVDVPVNRSYFALTFNSNHRTAAFHGRVFIDEENSLVRRIVLQGSGLPKDFGLQSPTLSLEYGMVRVAGQDHLLPLRSVLQVRKGKQVVRNETQFRDYRRFDASSEIKF